MYEKIQGIVVDVVRHNDRHNIVNLYTRQHGRLSFLSKIGVTARGKSRNSRLMPLSIVESDIEFHPNKELQTLRSVSTPASWHDIYFNPAKSAIVMFLYEFLNKFLRTSSPDTSLWDYIYDSLKILDGTDMRGTSNFHIAFLVNLSKEAGIYPRIDTRRQGSVLDLREGVFTSELPSHPDYLDTDETRMAYLVSRITFSNMRRFRLNAMQRNRIIDVMLRYYAIHLPGTSNLKSLDILREIF